MRKTRNKGRGWGGGPLTHVEYIPIYFFRNSCTPRIYFQKILLKYV